MDELALPNPEHLPIAQSIFLELIRAALQNGDTFGSKDDIRTQIVSLAEERFGIEMDEDFEAFQLFPECMRELDEQEDSDDVFMGPSYRVLVVIELGPSEYLAFDDQIETGEYDLIGIYESVDEAGDAVEASRTFS